MLNFTKCLIKVVWNSFIIGCTETQKREQQPPPKTVHILGTVFFGHFCCKTGEKVTFVEKMWAQKSSKSTHIYIYMHMPACCVASACFFLRPLQPQAILMLSWGAGPFLHLFGSYFCAILGNLGAQTPKMAQRGRWDCRTERASGHNVRFGFLCCGVSEKSQKWPDQKIRIHSSHLGHQVHATSRTQKMRKRKKEVEEVRR